MLHRSFKPAKCKTALKLAASRIKLLKNKREAQVKQLKRELAQLLESGQERTAMIRVEHVVREEKTLSAYDLIEIYCELIVARLPIIESQKNCPIDLKEAIASVVFASPRCADVPELMDVRKHFAAKYGKEFISAAIELRPDCGVGRMLIEKLSVKAPDGPAKIKILKSIAEEHNIKWDPSIENDPKPHEDLLNGPISFEKASRMHIDPPNVQVRPNYDERGQSSFQVPYSRAEKHNMPANLHDHNRSSAQYSQDSAPTGVVAKTSTISDTFHPEVRPPGSGNKEMEFRHSYPGNGSDFSSSRQNWNMEFKDAAEAAQAAAESAERASMAARAAAELSSRENRQYSSESHNSSAYGLRGDLPERYAGSRFEDEHLAKDQVNDGFNRKVPQIQNEQDNQASGVDERFYKNDQKSTNNSSSSSSVDDPVVNSSIMTDNSFGLERSDLTGRMNFGTQSSKSSFKSASEEQDNIKTESIDYSTEAGISKQSSRSCSPSHSRTLSDDHNNVVMYPNNDAGENPFAVTDDDGSIQSDTKQSSSHDKASLVFDESGSDDNEDVLDSVGKGQESNLFFSSPGRRSPTHLSTNINAWSPMQNVPDPVFSAGSVLASRSDDLLPVTFDDSDVSSSEGAEELDNSKHDERMDPRTFMSEHKSSFVDKGSVSDIKVLSLSQSFSNDMDSREVHPDGNQGMESISNIQEKFNIGDFPSKLKTSQVVSDDEDSDSSNDPVVEGNDRRAQQLSRPSLVHEEVKDNFLASQLPGIVRDADVKESSLDSGSELNLGMLTGGLRNKKSYTHPPYRKNPSGNAFLSKQAVEDTPSRIEQSSSSPRVRTTVGFGDTLREVDNLNSRTKKNEKSSSVASHAHLDNDSDEEVPKQMYSSSQEPHNISMSIEVNKKSTSRSPPTYFDSDNSNFEEDLVEPSAARKTRTGTGFSRRTKASPAQSDRHSPMKTTVLSESQGTLDRSVDTTETLSEPLSVTESSFHIGDLEWARKVAEPVSKPIPDSNRSLPKQRKEAEPVSKPIPDRNGPLPKERKEAEPVPRPIPDRIRPSPEEREVAERATKPIPDRKRPSPKEREVAEPGTKPIPDRNRPSSKEGEVAEPVTKPIPDSNRPSSEERLKSAAREQSSNSLPKMVLSGTSGSSKTSSSSAAKSPSKEKPSHVHPNLPDIDSLTAHLQSLRNNR